MEQTTITTIELAQWLRKQMWSDFAQSLADRFARTGDLSPKQEAAARKMYTKVTSKQQSREQELRGLEPLNTDGVFAKGKSVYKVQRNQSGTALYAKVLEVDDEGNGEWKYVGRKPLYFLTEEDRLTADRAAELGKLFGVCVRCGRILTHEDSIYNGYGATCAENAGWPYLTAPPLVLT